MSYEKVGYISIDKKHNHVFITSADSSIRPLHYTKWEFEEGNPVFLNKLVKLGRLILDREFQPNGSCNHKEFVTMLFETKHTIPFDPLDKDLHYHTKTNEIVDDYIARKIAIPYFYNDKTVDMEGIKQEIAEVVIPQITAIYDKAQVEALEKGLIYIRSALTLLDKFIGYDLLWSYDNEIIIAPKENYNNRGILDNSDESAIFLKRDSLTPKDAWEIVAYWDRDFCVHQFPVLAGLPDAKQSV